MTQDLSKVQVDFTDERINAEGSSEVYEACKRLKEVIDDLRKQVAYEEVEPLTYSLGLWQLTRPYRTVMIQANMSETVKWPHMVVPPCKVDCRVRDSSAGNYRPDWRLDKMGKSHEKRNRYVGRVVVGTHAPKTLDSLSAFQVQRVAPRQAISPFAFIKVFESFASRVVNDCNDFIV
ncbi:hypothetical protein NPIL_70581 [Nephila pilipes]|uniref:Uncharacterized protein n=1 Tax=Nephila pilipes TaxID=299642 RepID=A0A8X6UR11_NEPPI|nr:hypothetical protein NPIL_70581 [Nephila pilipes]